MNISRRNFLGMSAFAGAAVLAPGCCSLCCDKSAKVGLTPVFDKEYATTYFAEAKLILICRKLYRGRLTEEGFVDKAVLEDCYPNRDFHDLYIAQIEKVLIEE